MRNAHRDGLKIGMAFDWMVVDTRQRIGLDEDRTVVSSAEGTLDAQGRATLSVGSKIRFAPPMKSKLLRVYVFRKTGERVIRSRNAGGCDLQGDPAAPELPLQVVFGMPRSLNWYPNEADLNNFNVNGSI